MGDSKGNAKKTQKGQRRWLSSIQTMMDGYPGGVWGCSCMLCVYRLGKAAGINEEGAAEKMASGEWWFR